MKKEVACYTDNNWCTWNNPQRIDKGNGGLRNQKTSRDQPDNCIFDIGQNSKKSPGNVRGLDITEIP